MNGFELVSATAIGNTHYLARQNRQDALYVYETDAQIAGVICDGSSAYISSEVGATLAARIIHRVLIESQLSTQLSSLITQSLHEQLGALASRFPDLFVFNIVAFSINQQSTTVLRLGDAVVMIDAIEAPRSSSNYFDFKNRRSNGFEEITMSTCDWKSLLIASDGACEFDLRHSQLQADAEPLGKLENLLLLDQDGLTRKLQSAQQAFGSDGVGRSGILQDDLSIIVVRRF